MVLVEPATEGDIRAMTALLADLFAAEADFCPDAAKQARGLLMILNDSTRGCIFVARRHGEVVGMVSLLFSISTAEGAPACWLEDMVVRPDQRGAGIGSQLLECALEHARQLGLARITLLTDEENHVAIRFYQRHGFRRSAMIPLRLHAEPCDDSHSA